MAGMRAWLLIAIAALGCTKASKDEAPAATTKQPAPVTAGTVGADGVRAVAIEATRDGYAPDRIAGKPGEKLKLVFTRRESGGECMAQLKTPEGKIVDLPLDKPFEVAVTVPADGEVKFACGMEMFFGVIVAEKAKG